MSIRHEVIPFVGISAAMGVCAGLVLEAFTTGVAFILLGTACLLYFFRDPDWTPPSVPAAVLAGVDGSVVQCAVKQHCAAGCGHDIFPSAGYTDVGSVSAFYFGGELHLYRIGGSCSGPARHGRTTKPRVGAATCRIRHRDGRCTSPLGDAIRNRHDTAAP